MRNLLSFFAGLFSGLLFALVRAILLLDRPSIFWFWDLPCWAALARVCRAAAKRRAVCAAAVFLPVFFVPSALLLHSGTLVLANGRPLGLVEEADTLSAAVAEIEQSAGAARAGNTRSPSALKPNRPMHWRTNS